MSIISEISKLIDAGFTKEDIARFYDANSSKPKMDDEDKHKDNSNDNKEFDKNSNEIDSLTSQIKELTKLLQTSNVFKDEQPKPRTIDDIFESMFADHSDRED